jgi:hypothetical protein
MYILIGSEKSCLLSCLFASLVGEENRQDGQVSSFDFVVGGDAWTCVFTSSTEMRSEKSGLF